MNVCPDKNSQAWKDLVAKLGNVDGAYRVWLENNRNIPEVHNIIKPRDQDLIRQFTGATNSVVLIDREMTTPGRGEIRENGDIIVYINPDILQRDTIIHEFAHVYIELLGGINHPLVKAGLKKIKGTRLEAEILEKYPNLAGKENVDKLNKELVATALGRTGEEIFNSSDKSAIERFNAWVKNALAKLKRMLGMPEDAIRQLANEILEDRLRKDEFISPAATQFEQRSKKTPESVINRIKAQADFFEISEDENFYVGKKGSPMEGIKLERQSNYAERIRGKETEVNEPMRRGAVAGNFFDDIGRDVFKVIFQEDETALQTKEDYLAAVNKPTKHNPNPEHVLEVSDEVYQKVLDRMFDFAKELKDKGFTAEPEKMFVYSLFHENIQKELGYDGMGGTLDLLVKDPVGNYHIIDFKNKRFTALKWHDKNLYSAQEMPGGKMAEALVDKWGVQQTLYKVLTENYSELINIASINALVLSPDYTTASETGNRIVLKDFVFGSERKPVIETHLNENISHKVTKLYLNKPIIKRIKNDLAEGTIHTKETIDEALDELTEKEKLLKRAVKNIEKKIQKLREGVRSNDDINQSTINRLSVMLGEMKQVLNEQALLRYVEQAHRELSAVEKSLAKINEIADGKDAIKRIHFINITSKAFDTDTLIDISTEFKDSEEFPMLHMLASEVIAMKQRIDKTIYTTSVDILAKMPLLPHDKIVLEYEETAERIFNRNNTTVKGEERKRLQREFIKEYIADNAEEIQKKSIKHRKDMLTYIARDMSLVSGRLVNPKDQNSEQVDMLVYLAEISDFKTRDTFFNVLNELNATLEAYEAYVNVSQSNQKEFYKPLLREEGGLILPELITQGDTAKYNELKHGKYKGTPVEDLYDLFIRMSNLRDANLVPMHQLGNKLPTINKTGMERVLEDGLIAALKRGVRDKFKLNSKDDVDLGAVTAEIEDFTHKLTDKKRVIVNEANEEKAFIPIHFRAKIEDKDRSFDVATLLLLDVHQAVNFHNKTESLYIAERLRDVVADERTEVVQRSGLLGRVKINSEGDVVTGKGADSNHLIAMDNIIKQRWYGQQYTGDPQVIKVFKAIKSYSSFVMLSLNYLSAGANLFHGSTMAFIEGVSGEFYTPKNILRAQRNMQADHLNVMSDFGNRVKHSKTLVIEERLNARNDFNSFENNMSKNTKAKNLANFGSFYLLNAAGEYVPQTLLMNAFLDNVKVLDKDGNFLTRDGKPTQERDDAMSWYDAVEVGHQLKMKNKNLSKTYKENISSEEYAKLTKEEQNLYAYGYLVANPLAVTTELSRNGAGILSDATMFELTRKAGALNRFAFGNYADVNKSYAQTTAVGMLANHMRGFMVTGLLRRFRGMHTVYIKDDNARFGFRVLRNDELRTEDKYLNQELGILEQGYYSTTLRYFSRLVEDLSLFKLQLKGENGETWNELTDHERGNIKKTVTELGLGIAMLIGAIALAKSAEDEDDEELKAFKLLAAFYSRRLYSELWFYTNPTEALKILKSPAVSVSMLDGMVRALTQLITGPLETYDRGKNKDELKIKVKFMKLTPLKAFQRDVESALNFLKK